MDFQILHFTLILLFLYPISAISQPNPNVTLGSSLTANTGSSSWASPSREFAFGFVHIGSGGYLLAIWFSKIPDRTIVWSANRGNLAPEGSKIQLSQDGRFVLTDPSGQQIWSANSGSSGVAYGAMLDSGNFILASSVSAVLWQSFDKPTDSLLPTQVLGQGGEIVSSLSRMNSYSPGKYFLNMQNDGNLVLYTPSYPRNDYWSTNSVGSGFQFIFNQSGSVSLIARNRSIIKTVFSESASASLFYQRVTLDYDGVLRHYVYPKSTNSTAGRPMEWSSPDRVPSDICSRIIKDTTGSGVCGFNSYCSLSCSDGRPVCNCPDGYVLIDPNDTMSGCKPNFVPQNCDQESKESDLFYFVDLPDTNWPFSDFGRYEGVTEDQCRQVCLSDCFCAAVVYGNSVCWKKKFPLSNGIKDSSVGGKTLIKIRRDS